MTSFRRNLPAGSVHRHLKSAVKELHKAEHNVVLWFAEVLQRRLYRSLGHGSMILYAQEELGFSRSKSYLFIQLAQRLEVLPELRAAIASGAVSWTKARALLKVATPGSESKWVAAAMTASRRELEEAIKRARVSARSRARPTSQSTLSLGGKAARTHGSRRGPAAPGTHSAATTRGSHGEPAAPGTHGAATTHGAHGDPAAPGTHSAATTHGSHGDPAAPETHDAATTRGSHGDPTAPGTHSAATTRGSHGDPTAPGTHGAATTRGSHGGPAAPRSHGGPASRATLGSAAPGSGQSRISTPSSSLGSATDPGGQITPGVSPGDAGFRPMANPGQPTSNEIPLSPRETSYLDELESVEIPIRVGVDLDPVLHGRYRALIERIRKLRFKGTRAEMMVAAYEALAGQMESEARMRRAARKEQESGHASQGDPPQPTADRTDADPTQSERGHRGDESSAGATPGGDPCAGSGGPGSDPVGVTPQGDSRVAGGAHMNDPHAQGGEPGREPGVERGGHNGDDSTNGAAPDGAHPTSGAGPDGVHPTEGGVPGARNRAAQLSTRVDNPGKSFHRTGPNYQVMVTVCPGCERGAIAGGESGRVLSPTSLQSILCDSRVLAPGARNKSTIPPSRRREVLRRDGHRCRIRGCDRSLFVEVHHKVPREAGGTHDPDNLLTLCSACHRAVHHRFREEMLRQVNRTHPDHADLAWCVSETGPPARTRFHQQATGRAGSGVNVR